VGAPACLVCACAAIAALPRAGRRKPRLPIRIAATVPAVSQVGPAGFVSFLPRWAGGSLAFPAASPRQSFYFQLVTHMTRHRRSTCTLEVSSGGDEVLPKGKQL
jgi:hypothetical protein